MSIELSIAPLNGATRPPIAGQFSENNPFPATNNGKTETTENPSPKIDEAEQKASIERLQDALSSHDISLKFSRDDKTNQVIVELIDQQTGTAIRQIPSDVSLKLSAELGKLQGLIYKNQA